jgi:hypothetical protein
MVPELISAASNAKLSVGRLQAFLTAEEMTSYVHSNEESLSISVKNGSFSWDSAPTLENINFEVYLVSS